MNFPSSVQVVVWINDYFGAVEDGDNFTGGRSMTAIVTELRALCI